MCTFRLVFDIFDSCIHDNVFTYEQRIQIRRTYKQKKTYQVRAVLLNAFRFECGVCGDLVYAYVDIVYTT